MTVAVAAVVMELATVMGLALVMDAVLRCWLLSAAAVRWASCVLAVDAVTVMTVDVGTFSTRPRPAGQTATATRRATTTLTGLRAQTTLVTVARGLATTRTRGRWVRRVEVVQTSWTGGISLPR